MRQAVRSLDQLLAQLELSAASVGVSEAAARQFPVLVTPEWMAAMERGNPQDPLLRQVLPDAREEQPVPGFTSDPLQEVGTQATAGIVRKYRGRALLIATGACAVHCRYCFRRHFPYQEAGMTASRWNTAFAELRADPTLREVIFSGGDPLVLGNRPLGRMVSDLSGLPQLRWLRFHTRLPLVLPERVDAGLCEMLSATGLPTALVIHCNHPHELTPGARAALRRLRDCGVTLLNQSVLLRGINDEPDVLIRLSESLYAAGVLPYYLHLLDPVAGAAHFLVEDASAQVLHASIKARLPGYLVPRLVREIPGEDAKSWVR